MKLKQFVKKVLTDVVEAVDEASEEGEHRIVLNLDKPGGRTIEFDVAVTVESTEADQAGGGINVLEFVKAGGDMSSEYKNSTVSRIRFGVEVSPVKKIQ